MKRMMRYTAVVLATLAILPILWQFRLVLLLFLFSLFVAAMIRPLVDWLSERGFSKVGAQLALYVLAIGVFLLVLLLVGDLLLVELNSAANRAVVAYEDFHRRWQEEGAVWQQTVVQALPPPLTISAAQDTEFETMLPAVMNLTRGLVGALGGVALLLALSLYWSADQYRFERVWLLLLPPKRRTYARDSWREIETVVGSYLRSQTAQSVLAALLLGVGAWVAGLQYPLLFALFGAIAAFVPLFGGLTATVVGFALGSLDGYWVGVGTAVYTLIVFLTLGFFVVPRLWARERGSFLLMIVLLIPLVEGFGIWALLIAPPLAAALEVLIVQAYRGYVASRATAVQLDDLEARYRQLSQRVAQSENGAATPELRSLTKKLAELLASTRNVSAG